MSIEGAKREMLALKALEALKTAGVDEETIAACEKGFDYSKVIEGAVGMLITGADKSAAKNYVSIEMVGINLPWDRAKIELIRPGGKASADVVTELNAEIVSLRTGIKEAIVSLHGNDAYRGVVDKLRKLVLP